MLRQRGVTRRRPTLRLDELAEATVFGGVPAVERDLYWKPKTLGEIRRQSSRMAA
ncbi:MAG: hypothetical protein OXS35_07735 [Dehalococcoidia bacterium]|nr:hypothetical protein [Dehalococcoidia bacterium]